MEIAISVDRLWEGEMIGVVVGDVPVLIARLHGTFVAYRDACAHQAVRLSSGCLSGATLECPAHGWRYDLTTGRGINPASARLRRLPLAVQDGHVLVDPHGEFS